MTKIELREPPTRTVAGRRPVMPLDAKIMEFAGTAKRPVEIADRLRRTEAYAEITTQKVASRLKALVGRGYMIRIRPTGGPANGPGTSLYRVRTEQDEES